RPQPVRQEARDAATEARDAALPGSTIPAHRNDESCRKKTRRAAVKAIRRAYEAGVAADVQTSGNLRTAAGPRGNLRAVDERGDLEGSRQRAAAAHLVRERQRLGAVVDDRAAGDLQLDVLGPDRAVDRAIAGEVGHLRRSPDEDEALEVEVSLDGEVALDDHDAGALGVAVRLDRDATIAGEVRDLGGRRGPVRG